MHTLKKIRTSINIDNLRGDFFGGLTTAVIALPLAIAFGVAAYAPLGSEYIAQGALAGLYATIVAGFLASIFGGTPLQITGPTAPMSVVITAVIVNLTQDTELIEIGADLTDIVLMLVAATIIIGGILQIVLGFLGGGKLIKYIPYPVIAGFMNGIAVLIFLGQLRPFLGVAKDASFPMIVTGEVGVMYETIITGIITVVAILMADRFIKKIPATLIGLVVGIGAYFIIGNVASPDILLINNNSLIVGPIPSSIPSPDRIVSIFNLGGEIPLTTWINMLAPALILSILASIDTLLTSVVADVTTKTKTNSKKTLLAQGIGNIGSAIFGGLPAAGATVRTLVNINSGARTRISGMITSVAVLLIILVLSQFVQWIPMAVLAGILMVTAVKMVDFSNFRLQKRKSTLENLFIILTVTVITVTVDLMVAVGIGLLISCLLFVKDQITKSIVRRKYTGQYVHSKKIRPREEMDILEEHGDLIKVYELSDSLFFGTCDKLHQEIESDIESRCIILDFKRVHTVDVTGARLIRQIADRIHDKGNLLLISCIDVPGKQNKEQIWNVIEDQNIQQILGAEHIIADTDHALEWAEDDLIDYINKDIQYTDDTSDIEQFSIFKNLSPAQLKLVSQRVKPVSYNKGEIIFNEGDPGNGLYFILSGYVSVNTGQGNYRFATFSAGVFFGEMSIFDDQSRSATVFSETDTKLLFLSKEDFMGLSETDPVIAVTMLTGIASEISNRLRMTNGEVLALEE